MKMPNTHHFFTTSLVVCLYSLKSKSAFPTPKLGIVSLSLGVSRNMIIKNPLFTLPIIGHQLQIFLNTSLPNSLFPNFEPKGEEIAEPRYFYGLGL